MADDEKKFSLKDDLFNKKQIQYLSGLIEKAHPKLNKPEFEKDILSKFPDLELMERIYWISESFEKHLSSDFEETVNILLTSLKDDSTSESFIFSPYSDYIAKNGCSKKHLKKSLKTLGEFTKHFSAEFAIRKFINNFPEETFAQMHKWSHSKNAHQRRLASEGLRPNLPWGKAIDFDYKKGARPLDNLFYDKSRYVTRSVANHLNDISKINPDFVLEKLLKWKESQRQKKEEMEYIINHSLRTLVKKGNIRTLEFLGYKTNLNIKIKEFIIKNDKIRIGDTLEFSFIILPEDKEKLLIDYKIIYPTPHTKVSEKVFKIKKVLLKKDEELRIEKKHPFKKISTKKLYNGKYELGLQINGKIIKSTFFELEI